MKFEPTRWSLIVAAGQRGGRDGPGALEELCKVYWAPIYAFIRRKGYSTEAAEDLTQGFLTSLIERNSLSSADPVRGKFRTFLLACVQNYLAKELRRENTEKRGGKVIFTPLRGLDQIERLAIQAAHDRTPEQSFERQWALTVLAQSLKRLEENWKKKGKAEEFEALKPVLTGELGKVPYGELAERLKRTPNAVKILVHRLRTNFGQVLREEIAQTLTENEDTDAELRYLLEVLQK
ncbi:MAG: sigma-70 family RNA polymerase sigma factor [Candidatus Hydrogenedentota bacterium]